MASRTYRARRTSLALAISALSGLSMLAACSRSTNEADVFPTPAISSVPATSPATSPAPGSVPAATPASGAPASTAPASTAPSPAPAVSSVPAQPATLASTVATHPPSTSKSPSTSASVSTSLPVAQPTPTPGPVAGQPLSGKVIVLDPGHNLNQSSSINRLVNAGNGVIKACDTTGTSTNAGYPEHAFTWDVASRAAAILRSEGATVIFTRTSDTGIGPCVTTRAQIGNDAHADAFIAIHADGGPAGGHGFFVMQPPPNNPNVNPGGAPQSRVLATTMHNTFHATTGMPYSTYITSGYYPDTTTTGTVNLSHGPVITIECLNMRSATDAAIATDPAWRQRIAGGIAAGLTAFLTR